MKLLAPAFALNAAAVDAASDPHLATGRHLRLLPNPRLGPPVLPYFVHRLNVGKPPAAANVDWRDDLRVVDGSLQEQALPCPVLPNQPLHLHFAPPQRPVCVHVDAVPQSPEGLRIEAWVDGVRGPERVAVRSAPPYTLAGGRIDRVTITGRGTAKSALWLDAATLLTHAKRGDAWRLWSLPLNAARPYYTPTTAASSDAMARLLRGAPKRQPMYRAPAATEPANAPLIANPGPAEQARLQAPAIACTPLLEALLSAAKPLELPHAVQQPDDDTTTARVSDTLHLAGFDSGMARWLGCADVDNDSQIGGALVAPGEVVVYAIGSYWQQSRSAYGPNHLAMPLLQGSVIATSEAVPQWPTRGNLPAAAAGPYFGLATVCCVAAGLDSGQPGMLTIDGFDSSRPFMPPLPPAVPPHARREIGMSLSGLSAAASVAWCRKDQNQWRCLNPVHGEQPGPLLLSTEPAGTQDGELPGPRARLLDRDAPADAVSYRFAQADLWGRWSGWTEGLAPAKARPRPPAPVFTVAVKWPAPPWPPAGALTPRILLSIPVPELEHQAPGSRTITSLRLIVDGGPAMDIPLPAGLGGAKWILEQPGPSLQPCASTLRRYVAHWVDSGNAVSPPSPELERKISDPRPPPPIVFDAKLAYGSRVDATGKSRIDIRWTPSAGQALTRVYHVSETVLLSKLEKHDEALFDELQGITGLAERASFIADHAAEFPRDWFELLERDPRLQPQPETGRLVHEVSGALRTLGFYRVVPVSASNVESPFADSPMIAAAVPNAPPPPQPLVEVRVLGSTATLRVKVPRGPTPPVHYRLRRTAGGNDDTAGMPIIASAPLPVGAGNTAEHFILEDSGLKLWRRYLWRIELRGADLPGSGSGNVPPAPGNWSKPSASVSAAVVPTSPPAEVSGLSLVSKGVAPQIAWMLQFSYPAADLQGGSFGSFQFAVLRAEGPALARELLRLPALPCLSATGIASIELPVDGHPAIAIDTAYSVLVIDPLGRRSASGPPLVHEVAPSQSPEPVVSPDPAPIVKGAKS